MGNKRRKAGVDPSTSLSVRDEAYVGAQSLLMEAVRALEISPAQQSLVDERFVKVVGASPRGHFARNRLPYSSSERFNSSDKWRCVKRSVLAYVFRGVLPRKYVRALEAVSRVLRLCVDGPITSDLPEKAVLALAELEAASPWTESSRSRHDIFHLVRHLLMLPSVTHINTPLLMVTTTTQFTQLPCLHRRKMRWISGPREHFGVFTASGGIRL